MLGDRLELIEKEISIYETLASSLYFEIVRGKSTPDNLDRYSKYTDRLAELKHDRKQIINMLNGGLDATTN